MYSQEVADTLCAALADGKSLREACKADGMPAPSTVVGWLKEDSKAEFAEQYTRAREIGYSLLSDELLEIADDKTEADTNRARLQVDTRKWMLSKMLPKTYGDKLTTEVTGGLKHDHTHGLSDASLELLRDLSPSRADGGVSPPEPD